MTERLLMAAFLVWLASFALPKPPLTSSQLQVKAKEKSISQMCDKKPKRQGCERFV
jgi:hypothetical protein